MRPEHTTKPAHSATKIRFSASRTVSTLWTSSRTALCCVLRKCSFLQQLFLVAVSDARNERQSPTKCAASYQLVQEVTLRGSEMIRGAGVSCPCRARSSRVVTPASLPRSSSRKAELHEHAPSTLTIGQRLRYDCFLSQLYKSALLL